MIGSVVAEAVAAARRGALIVLPTDTVYGVGTRPDDATATARVFEAKGRPRDLTLPVLVARTADAERIAVLDDRARRLVAVAWPGPLTLVVPRTALSRAWDLGGDPETIGVRVPDEPLALAVLAAAGPLAVTSANRSGDQPARTCEELVATFGDLVEVYLCAERPLEGRASTVVDLAHGAPVVLREGEIGATHVERFLSGTGPLLDSRPS